MPAIHLRFDPLREDDLSEAASSVEFKMILDDRINTIATGLGFRTLDDMIGVSEGEWNELLEVMPPHLHERWSAERSPWFSCDQGIAWGHRLIAYIADHPREFNDWPSHQAHATEELRTSVTALETGRSRGAKFRLLHAA